MSYTFTSIGKHTHACFFFLFLCSTNLYIVHSTFFSAYFYNQKKSALHNFFGSIFFELILMDKAYRGKTSFSKYVTKNFLQCIPTSEMIFLFHKKKEDRNAYYWIGFGSWTVAEERKLYCGRRWSARMKDRKGGRKSESESESLDNLMEIPVNTFRCDACTINMRSTNERCCPLYISLSLLCSVCRVHV